MRPPQESTPGVEMRDDATRQRRRSAVGASTYPRASDFGWINLAGCGRSVR